MSDPAEGGSRRPRVGRVTLLAAIGVATLLTAAGAPMLSRLSSASPMQATGPMLPYHGRFSEEPATLALADALPQLIERATRTAAIALGVSADPSRFRLRLVDDASGVASMGQFVARTLVGTHGPIVIELRLEPLLARRIDLERTLTHEATHAVLASALGSGYASIPEWLREGIAVDVAGETELNLSRAISRTRLRPVEGIADGLSRTAHFTSDYGESGVAIATLRSLAGDDAVPRLVACLTDAGTWPSCLRDLTGLQPKQFEARAMIDALAAIGDLAADRVSRYEAARARLQSGNPARALEDLEAFLASGEGPFDREASLDSARALALLERHDEALDQVDALLGLGDYGPELGAEALAFKAEANRRAGHHALAERVCRELLLFYGRDGSANRAACPNLEPYPITADRGADRP